MKICLVNPPFLFPRRENLALSHCLGLRSLSSYLAGMGGHRVTFVDSLFLGLDRVAPYGSGLLVGLPHEETVRRIPRDSEMIAVGAPFSQLAPVVHELLMAIRSRFPDAALVLGGMYPSTQLELASTSCADYIVVGEGETALGRLAAGEDPKQIPGVHARGSLSPSPVSRGEMVPNLDDLPWPDYGIPYMEQYFAVSPRGVIGRTASMVTSRGCPYDCEFCSIHPVYGWQFRARSAGSLLEEIEFLARRFRVRTLEFEDDNLTFDAHRAEEILEGLIHLRERGYPLKWRAPNGIRMDSLEERTVALMKQSGCEEVALALEHGDQAMLDLMGKRLDLNQAYRVLEWCSTHQIPRTYIFYMVGYPGETEDSFERGLEYLKGVRRLRGAIRLSINLAQPYPGTRLLARCRREGYITDPEYDNFLAGRELMNTQYAVSVETPELTRQVIEQRRAAVAAVFESGNHNPGSLGRLKSSLRRAPEPYGKAADRHDLVGLLGEAQQSASSGHVLNRYRMALGEEPRPHRAPVRLAGAALRRVARKPSR